jgi:drug/metabolite transporter (DMT)-like permease
VSPAALALVLTAAVLHAGWNLRLHGTDDRVASMAVAGLVAGAVLLPFAVAAPPTAVVGLTLLTGVLESAYGLALAAAYARGALSLTYPLGRGTAPLLATVGAWVVLSQRPTGAAVLGAMLLGGGLGLLGLEAHRARSLPAAGFAVLVGVVIASYSVVDARAVQEVSPVPYLGAAMLLQGVLTTAVTRFDAARLRAALRPGALIGLGSLAAYLLVLYAFRVAPVGRVRRFGRPRSSWPSCCLGSGRERPHGRAPPSAWSARCWPRPEASRRVSPPGPAPRRPRAGR